MNLRDNRERLPTPPGLEKGKYRHYKGGVYDVVGVALHTETLESLVVYRPLKHTKGAEFWVRPYEMFVERVVVDGKSIPRFDKID